MLTLRRFVLALAFFMLPTAPAWSQCPFCDGEKGTTLIGHFDEALIVLYGHFENPRGGADDLDQGQTDFVIEKVLKTNDAVKNKQKIVVRREVRDVKNKYIVFC